MTHTLKGSADVFAAKRVFNAAFALEKMGGNEHLTDAEASLSELEVEVEKLTAALKSLVAQP